MIVNFFYELYIRLQSFFFQAGKTLFFKKKTLQAGYGIKNVPEENRTETD